MNKRDVASLVAELQDYAESYHNGEIGHAKLTRLNHGVWATVERLGVRDEVLRALRFNERWCRCTTPEAPRMRYFDDREPDVENPELAKKFGTSHGWACADCGRLIQEG